MALALGSAGLGHRGPSAGLSGMGASLFSFTSGGGWDFWVAGTPCADLIDNLT